MQASRALLLHSSRLHLSTYIYISQRASEWGFGNARGRSRDVIAERESASMRWGLCFRALRQQTVVFPARSESSPHHSFPPLYSSARNLLRNRRPFVEIDTHTHTSSRGSVQMSPEAAVVACAEVRVYVCIGSSGTLFLPAKFRHFPGPPYDS